MYKFRLFSNFDFRFRSVSLFIRVYRILPSKFIHFFAFANVCAQEWSLSAACTRIYVGIVPMYVGRYVHMCLCFEFIQFLQVFAISQFFLDSKRILRFKLFNTYEFRYKHLKISKEIRMRPSPPTTTTTVIAAWTADENKNLEKRLRQNCYCV